MILIGQFFAVGWIAGKCNGWVAGKCNEDLPKTVECSCLFKRPRTATRASLQPVFSLKMALKISIDKILVCLTLYRNR